MSPRGKGAPGYCITGLLLETFHSIGYSIGARSVLTRGRRVFFQKGPKCQIGAEVVEAEVEGAEVSKILINRVAMQSSEHVVM